MIRFRRSRGRLWLLVRFRRHWYTVRIGLWTASIPLPGWENARQRHAERQLAFYRATGMRWR